MFSSFLYFHHSNFTGLFLVLQNIAHCLSEDKVLTSLPCLYYTVTVLVNFGIWVYLERADTCRHMKSLFSAWLLVGAEISDGIFKLHFSLVDTGLVLLF